MQKLEIKGGKKLSGTILISGSKNATLPILASTILTEKKDQITKKPIEKDEETMALISVPVMLAGDERLEEILTDIVSELQDSGEDGPLNVAENLADNVADNC